MAVLSPVDFRTRDRRCVCERESLSLGLELVKQPTTSNVTMPSLKLSTLGTSWMVKRLTRVCDSDWSTEIARVTDPAASPPLLRLLRGPFSATPSAKMPHMWRKMNEMKLRNSMMYKTQGLFPQIKIRSSLDEKQEEGVEEATKQQRDCDASNQATKQLTFRAPCGG